MNRAAGRNSDHVSPVNVRLFFPYVMMFPPVVNVAKYWQAMEHIVVVGDDDDDFECNIMIIMQAAMSH